MSVRVEVYLDVETDWDRNLTMVGLQSAETGVIQLVGGEITTARLRSVLPRDGVLYTYNGHCFDLPVIRKQLALDLRATFLSHDLRWICQRHGIRGGQKAIERQLGVSRATEGVDGWEAILLWRRHLAGDLAALDTLLRYNREDLAGLVAIRDHLHGEGLLPP